jgi:hypothetical protein
LSMSKGYAVHLSLSQRDADFNSNVPRTVFGRRREIPEN